MLVASGIQVGDEAALALPVQIIGHIHTVIGCGTLTRASGVTIQAESGAPVGQDDVIETDAEGRMELRFIDGTLFNLASGTRVVLREFVFDTEGASPAALFDVTRGSFSFVAGRLAETGALKLNTPVASIRPRSHAGGFGMLTLAALTFSVLKDAKAADPDATFLDDDSITYKDLAHGAFELVTKEPIPRRIIVDDPGQTVVLNRIGSSVSVNPILNSAARMEELRAAQQEALANLQWQGPNGSSTPPFVKSQPLQPINFIPPDAPAQQNLLQPLSPFVMPIFEPVPPTLNTGAGPIELDTVVFDTFTATSGTFAASSTNSAAGLTFGVIGATTGNTVLGGVTYDLSKTSPYGTLYVNSTSGAYTFVPDSAAINALKTPTTDNFVITVSDGLNSASQTFTININGVEDAAIISGTAAGSVTEAGSAINATPGLQTATGRLTDTDPDDPPNTFTAVSSPTKSAGGYGTFTMTATGVWTYTLNEANSAVRALKVGDTLTDTFTVTSIGGTPKVVTVTIHGPLIDLTGAAPSLTLSETHLTATPLDDNIAGSAPDVALTTTSANFSTAFVSVQGVDGATVNYALSITGGNGTASGLIDSHTGQADVLVLNGNTVEGHVGATGGALAFTITVDPTTGIVTFTEYRAVTQPFGTSPDGREGASLPSGIVNLSATITDQNGNFQTVTRDLGSRLTVTDDGPTIAALGTAPSLTLSEAHLTATTLDDNVAGSAPNATLATTSGDFSTAFTSVQGADGATIRYALSITGGNGAASGLIDSHTGQADVLVLNGNTIEGHVGSTGGTLAFTITLDPTTGRVTFTDYRAVTQPFGTNPDGGEGVSLTAGIVNLTATIADKDGDFQTATLDLGSRLTITDDGPTIGGFDHATILAKDGQVANGTFNVNFGADGESAMLVAVHNGAVNGFNLATTDLGGGITSVHVTGNGDDYTFYYTTRAVSGGVELNAFFADTGGTLSDPFFTLLINPDGTYKFDVVGVGFLQQTTVSGSDFGASGSGQPSLTAPDGLLVITGDCNGAPADVKASSNGIAVGDTGLQMDQTETLLLTFKPEQTDVSFNLTQWQGNGTADVVFKVFDGATEVHDFNINVPKPSGDAHIVVEQTSNPALVNTFTFDKATSTYTLYVGSEFNQIGVSYDHAAAGNTTFTVNNITYSEGPRIPSTDLLFDVTAVDRDRDTSTTSLQVDLQGSGPSGFTSSATPQAATTTINGTNDAAIVSGAATGLVIETAGAMPATPTGANVNNPPNTFTAVSSPTQSGFGYGTFTMTAAGVWTYALDSNNFKMDAFGVGDTPTDHFTVTGMDGTTEVVAIPIHSTSDAAPDNLDNHALALAAISDPPKLDGPPQGETVASGRDAGQIIHVHASAGDHAVSGTGRSDLPGPGDANKGDDTILGGTGNTAINGNNGNDTITSGFGADHLTGSHGNDRFAHLFVADSHAGQFDTIAEFASGADKIDLTALGALGFVILALSSTNTSVPAHTIAWLYDSTANETIVYVNPTDQTLHIGASGLLEIHLQGIATIDASDFIQAAAPVVAAASESLDLTATAQSDATPVMTTTSGASSDSTGGDGTLLAGGSSTIQSTDASHSLGSSWDRIGWTEHSSPSSSDEVLTHAAETTGSVAAARPASGLSTIVQHVAAPTETSFVFDHFTGVDTDTTTGRNGAMAGGSQMPDLAFAALNHAHNALEEHAGRGLALGNDDGDHSASHLENAADAARSHGHASNDGADTTLNPSLLKSSNGGINHSLSSEVAEQHNAPHEVPGSTPGNSLHLGDAFQFRDDTPRGRGSQLSTELDHLPDPADHHNHAGGVHESEAASMLELSPPSIDPSHGAGTIHANVHDLIV